MSFDLDDDNVYEDFDSLRIEDLENRRAWKIVTYRDPNDVRKTRTNAHLRKTIDDAPSVTGMPRLPAGVVDYVWINGMSEKYSKGMEISIDRIVALLQKKGFDENSIRAVDNNLANTFIGYKRKFQK